MTKRRLGEASLPAKVVIVVCVVLAIAWVFVYSSGPDVTRRATPPGPSQAR